MLTILFLIILASVIFAYIPLTLVVIHSRTGKIVNDKYHDIKRRYWHTDYYGDSELSIHDLEKEVEKYHERSHS